MHTLKKVTVAYGSVLSMSIICRLNVFCSAEVMYRLFVPRMSLLFLAFLNSSFLFCDVLISYDMLILLCLGFVDLERAFGGVPGEVMGWVMRGLGVGEWLASAVMSVCTGARTVVGAVCGNGRGFEVEAGVQH